MAFIQDSPVSPTLQTTSPSNGIPRFVHWIDQPVGKGWGGFDGSCRNGTENSRPLIQAECIRNYNHRPALSAISIHIFLCRSTSRNLRMIPPEPPWRPMPFPEWQDAPKTHPASSFRRKKRAGGKLSDLLSSDHTVGMSQRCIESIPKLRSQQGR